MSLATAAAAKAADEVRRAAASGGASASGPRQMKKMKKSSSVRQMAAGFQQPEPKLEPEPEPEPEQPQQRPPFLSLDDDDVPASTSVRGRSQLFSREISLGTEAGIDAILSIAPEHRCEADIDSLQQWSETVDGALFRHLTSSTVRREICKSLRGEAAAHNTVLYRSGEATDKFYVVVKGEVTTEAAADGGGAQVQHLAGTCFGADGGGGGVRTATAIVTDDSFLGFLSRFDYVRIVPSESGSELAELRTTNSAAASKSHWAGLDGGAAPMPVSPDRLVRGSPAPVNVRAETTPSAVGVSVDARSSPSDGTATEEARTAAAARRTFAGAKLLEHDPELEPEPEQARGGRLPVRMTADTVVAKFIGEGKLGLVYGDRWPYISSIRPGSPGAQVENLTEGCRLLSINGMGVDGIPYKDTAPLVRSRPVQLIFARPPVAGAQSIVAQLAAHGSRLSPQPPLRTSHSRQTDSIRRTSHSGRETVGARMAAEKAQEEQDHILQAGKFRAKPAPKAVHSPKLRDSSPREAAAAQAYQKRQQAAAARAAPAPSRSLFARPRQKKQQQQQPKQAQIPADSRLLQPVAPGKEREPPSAHERTRALDTHSSVALHMSTEERRSHERSAIQATLRQAMHAQRSVFGQTIHDPSDAFAAFDRDGSGKLSPDELFKALQRLGLGLGEQQLSLLGAFLDEDGDGEVDYGELLSFLSDGHEESTAVQTHPLPTQQRQTAQALQAGADDDPDADAPAPPPAPLWSDELEAPAPTTADTRTLGEALEPEPESEPDVIDRSCWEYDRPGKGWQAYDDEAQQQLRSSFAADPNGTCAFQQTAHMPASDDEVFNYKVDFSTGPNFKVQLFKPFDTDRVALWDVRRRDSSWCLTHEARDGADAPLRILCIDGGGSKGLIPAITMQKIEQMCAPHQIHELFDVVAGTSTGGILALGTCIAGATAEEMAEVYETRSDEIWTTKRGGGSWNFLSAQAQYDAAKLTAILKESSVGRDGTTQVGIEHFLPCFKSIILVYFGLL